MITIPLNSSSLCKLNCEVRYSNTVFKGLHPIPTHEATFGVAFHEFCKTYEGPGDLPMKALRLLEQFKVAEGKKFLGACAGRPNFRLGTNVFREYQFKIPIFKGVTARGTEVQVCLMGTIDDGSLLDDAFVLSDYKTKRTPDFSKAINEYTNGVQLTLYHYVVKKYHHLFIPQQYWKYIQTGKSFARYIMVMLSRDIPEWHEGPLTELTPQYMALFEANLQCTAERVFDMYDAYEESPALMHRDGWVTNQCIDCEYSRLCHAKDDFELTAAMSAYTEYVYDPHNYQH